MTASDEQILVVTGGSGVPPAERAIRGVPSVLQDGLNTIAVSTLKKNMTAFFNQLREILDTGTAEFLTFEVNKVEVSAQITADGKVALLGSGGQIGVKGGITFVLQRKNASCATPISTSG